MDEILALCEMLQGTLVSERWRSLIDLYADADAQAIRFSSGVNVHCPSGCGTCCEHFLPDLSEVEASLAAAYMLFIKKDVSLFEQLAPGSQASSACPLYNPDSPYHCTIYPARALICRLFGSCPSEDKAGNIVFRGCKYNTNPESLKLVAKKTFEDIDPPLLPMSRFGMRLIDICGMSGTEPLPQAILKSADRLQFIARVLGSGDGDDNGGTDPDIPTPVAS